MNLDEEKDTIAQNIMALIQLAASNFPESTDMKLSVEGKNSGSITINSYTLREIIKEATE